MPAALEFREDGRVVYIKFSSPLKVAEVTAMMVQDKAHRDQFQREYPGSKVHLVADVLHLISIPQGFMQTRQSPSLSHPTKGQVAVIGAQRLVRTIAETIFRMTSFEQAKFFDNEADAMVYMRTVIANGDKAPR